MMDFVGSWPYIQVTMNDLPYLAFMFPSHKPWDILACVSMQVVKVLCLKFGPSAYVTIDTHKSVREICGSMSYSLQLNYSQQLRSEVNMNIDEAHVIRFSWICMLYLSISFNQARKSSGDLWVLLEVFMTLYFTMIGHPGYWCGHSHWDKMH